nr:helix-turn-helix domain-containing protein [Streptomyces sp. Z38]
MLRELKGRTDRSYGRLARRLGMNTSTLHRYCAGDAVPVDFAPIERFAALCGATPEERLDLHRLWLRAAEARRRPRGGAASFQVPDSTASDAPGEAGRRAPAVEQDSGADASSEAARCDRPDTPSHGELPGSSSGPAVEAKDSSHAEGPGGDDTRVVSGPVGRPPTPRTRRWRRKRAVVAVAAMCAVLATVGSLSFLPDDRKTSGTGAVGAAEESQESGIGDGAGPARSVALTVRDRLADELLAPPSLADLAADLGLSRYQLLRAFRTTMGVPPYAWLAQHRVARARALLDAGVRPAEAAALVGFADQAHLTRWFRRVLGVTPAAYRNSVQDAGC